MSHSSLIVPEPDGMSVRIYEEHDKVADQELIKYYCSRCDSLYQKSDNGMYIKNCLLPIQSRTIALYLFKKFSLTLLEIYFLCYRLIKKIVA